MTLVKQSPAVESHVLGLRCRECAREYPVSPIYTCEWCFGPLEVAYDYDEIRRNTSREKIASGPLSLWRYADLLPVTCNPSVDLGAGFTPLVRADRLAAEVGLGEVWIKNDTRNPTNSFKDRVVAVAVAKALDFGLKTIACASTGNLANSVAAQRRTRVCAATCSSRRTSSRARSSPPRCTAATSSRSTATTTTSTACVRSSPACTSGRSST